MHPDRIKVIGRKLKRLTIGVLWHDERKNWRRAGLIAVQKWNNRSRTVETAQDFLGRQQSGEKRQLCSSISWRNLDKVATRETPLYHTTTRSLNSLDSLFIAMASDEVIWDIINQQFCSFKLKCASSPRRPSPPTNIIPEPTKAKPSVATSTTSPASAANSHVPLPTRATPPSAPTHPQAASTST